MTPLAWLPLAARRSAHRQGIDALPASDKALVFLLRPDAGSSGAGSHPAVPWQEADHPRGGL